MPQAVQNGKTNLAFSNVQAYTLAVITLAIGIAVGYFARGSAPVSTAGENTQAASAPAGMGNAPMGSAQLPGIGSGQQQQAPSPEMVAKSAEPLLAQLKTNPSDFDTVVKPVSYTHLRAHETDSYLVCRLLLEKKKNTQNTKHLQLT